MDRYARALQYMLDFAESQPDRLEGIGKSQKSLRKQAGELVDKELLRSLNKFHVQPFKDSLRIDFMNLIESYVKRREKNPRARYPRIRIDADELMNRLEKPGVSMAEFNKLYEKLDSQKTVYFCRYSDHRDYSLLFNPYKKRLYAKLYLLSQHDEFKLIPHKNPGSIFQVVGKNKLLTTSGRPERFIIVPLSFGKKQEQLLLEALEKPGMLKTARLLKKNDEYYLSVNIAIEPEKIFEVNGYAGFSMADECTMVYTVCGLEGEMLKHGEIEIRSGEGIPPSDRDGLHILANSMTRICLQYKAQAVLETFPRYNALTDILDYKMPLKGLQKPVRVSPFGLWQTCPRCGYNRKKNKVVGDVFLCACCGFGIKRKFLPPYNLAKRLIKYQNDKVHFYCEQHGNRRIIRNALLDISYPLGPSEGIHDFFEYIEKKTDELRGVLSDRENEWTRQEKKLYSVWNKLLTAGDIKDVIVIES